MTFSDFKRTVSDDRPPADWNAAHQIAQDIDDATGAWIHAYLHRKEGDLANAGYWYRRARKLECRESLETEWEEIATALLVEP